MSPDVLDMSVWDVVVASLEVYALSVTFHLRAQMKLYSDMST